MTAVEVDLCPACDAAVDSHLPDQARRCRTLLSTYVRRLQPREKYLCDWPLCQRTVSRRGDMCFRHECPPHH